MPAEAVRMPGPRFLINLEMLFDNFNKEFQMSFIDKYILSILNYQVKILFPIK